MQKRTSDAIVDMCSRIRELSNRFIQEKMEQAGIEGIVPAHGQIIFPLLSANGPLALGTIVEISGRAKSTISGMADTLEKKGYLVRSSCPEDKRSILVELTDKGKGLKEYFSVITQDLRLQIFEGFSENEKNSLGNLLSRIEQNLGSLLEK